MAILYPFIEQDLGRLVLWFSFFAGLTACLFNGVASEERWGKAAVGGFWGVVTTMIQTAMIVVRSVFISIFAGTIAAGVMIAWLGDTKIEAIVLIVVAGAAFLADPILNYVRVNWKPLTEKVLRKIGVGSVES